MKPRIIAGSAKKTLLNVPQKGTRPMTGRIKQSVFSLIEDFIPEANVLDLFAGSGALGIEMLSRGSHFVTFIDKSSEAIDCIKENLAKTGFQAMSETINIKAQTFVQNRIKYSKFNELYDVIFISPPHKIVNLEIIENATQLLTPGGLVVAEAPKSFDLPKKINDLKQVEHKIYGITQIGFYIAV